MVAPEPSNRPERSGPDGSDTRHAVDPATGSATSAGSAASAAPATPDTSDTSAAAQLRARHTAMLQEAMAALAARSYYSRYPESPSPRVYGEQAGTDGLAAYQAHLGKRYQALADQPGDGSWVGAEVSPYGPVLAVSYPHLDLAAALAAAQRAVPGWRDAGAWTRAAVCAEIVDRINSRSFEIAHAVMHTAGQPFVMAFQAAGPNAQDRALEAVAAALAEQERVPASALWVKPGRGEPTRMVKEYRIVPRGVAVVVCCNTFPTWNTYPGLFASLATGNPVLVKPHPRAVLPLAITVEVARQVLREAGFDPALVQLAPQADDEPLAAVLAQRPEVAIIDYTGGPTFGGWLEQTGAARGALVCTEKAGLNSVVIDSTDDLAGMLANLAFSVSLYTGQMCTTPQNLYLPADGIDTDEGHLGFDEVADRLAAAVTALTGVDERAVELLGATVNDGVRERAAGLDALASQAGGRVVLASRRVTHPQYPQAVVRAPGLVAVDADREDVYTREHFGPVTLVVRTGSTQESLERFRATIRAHGAMTASVYATAEPVLAAARAAAVDAGVALSENLTDGVYVNQTAAFSDFHGTGANPAANAAYTDAAFVAPRFRVVTTRRHV